MSEKLSIQLNGPADRPKALAFAPENLDIGRFLNWSGYTETPKTTNLDLRYFSVAQKSEIFWAIFQSCKHQLIHTQTGVDGRKEMITRDRDLQEKLNLLQILWSDARTREHITNQYQKHRQEENLKQQPEYLNYLEISNNTAQLEELLDKIVAQLFSQRHQNPDRLLILTYQNIRNLLISERLRLEEIYKGNPELAACIEFERLKKYKQQLEEENFIWTDSRRRLLEKLEEKLLMGRPILVLSESGAGKTALIEAAAIKLTSKPLARSSGGTTQRAQELFATKAIDREGSFWEYQKIMQALSGKNTNRDTTISHQGQFFLDDEFNTRSTSTQMEIVKSFSLGIKPGKNFQPPNMAVYEVIQPYFAYIAAGNPPSHRYDRSNIDVAVEREFSGSIIEIDYLEQSETNPELFQIMLAALLDENNRLAVAAEEIAPEFICEASSGQYILKRDLKSGGFLWRFANCWREWFKSFAGQPNIISQKYSTIPAEEFYLTKLILDPGVVLDWLKTYRSTDLGNSLEIFMLKKIEEFINQPNFPKEDRILAKKFLQEFGIDIDGQNSKFPTFKVLTPREIGFLNPNVPRRSREIEAIGQPQEKIFVLPNGDEISYREELPFDYNKDYYVGQDLSEKNSGRAFRILGTEITNQVILLLEVDRSKKISQLRDFKLIPLDQLSSQFEFVHAYENKKVASWHKIDELRQIHECQYDWLIEQPTLDLITAGFWGVINLGNGRYSLALVDRTGNQLVSHEFTSAILNFSVSANGQEIVVLLDGQQKELKIINRQGKEITSRAFPSFVSNPSFTSSAQEMLLQTSSTEVKIIDRNDQELFVYDFGQLASLVKISANGQRIIAKTSERGVTIVDRVRHTIHQLDLVEEISALDVSANGQEILIKVGAKTLDIYQIEDDNIKKLSSHRFRKSIYNPTFSFDGRSIILQKGGRKDITIYTIIGKEKK